MPVRVLVLRAPGTNCDEETVEAWRLAGAEVELRHVGEIAGDLKRINSYGIITIPGGFSYGDDLGAGRILGASLRHVLGDALQSFRDKGGLILGICNGFQVLVQSGLLPGNAENHKITLTFNDIGRFVSCWTRLAPRAGLCPFFSHDRMIELPVAHGEGKFLAANPSIVDELERSGQVVLRYADGDGQAAGVFPLNPNGSSGGIAGLCDPSGQILGLMPHPERFVKFYHHPRWTRDRRRLDRDCDGLQIFRNAVDAMS